MTLKKWEKIISFVQYMFIFTMIFSTIWWYIDNVGFVKFAIRNLIGMIIFIPIYFFIQKINYFHRRITHPEKDEIKISGPAAYSVLVFIVVFIYSALNRSIQVQKFSLIYLGLTSVLMIIKYGINRVRTYIFINERVRTMPKKRIEKTGVLGIIVIAGIIMVIVSISVFQAGYFNIKQPESFNLKMDASEMEDFFLGEMPQRPIDMDEILATKDTKPLIPQIVWIVVEYIIVILVMIVILFLVCRGMIRLRHMYKMEDDIIESTIYEDVEDKEEQLDKKKFRIEKLSMSRNMRIRRRYKRHIEKSAKEKPSDNMTPTELENWSGAANKKENLELHRLYEEVRYGDEKN